MIQPLDQSIIELLNASRDDAADLHLPVSDRSFGFHAQQAVEKLLKVLIGAHQQRYKFTHDLSELVRHVEALHETLPVPSSLVADLTDYAGVWRYQEPQPLSPLRRADLIAVIAALRAYVLARLDVLRPGVDWTQHL